MARSRKRVGGFMTKRDGVREYKRRILSGQAQSEHMKDETVKDILLCNGKLNEQEAVYLEDFIRQQIAKDLEGLKKCEIILAKDKQFKCDKCSQNRWAVSVCKERNQAITAAQERVRKGGEE